MKDTFFVITNKVLLIRNFILENSNSHFELRSQLFTYRIPKRLGNEIHVDYG